MSTTERPLTAIATKSLRKNVEKHELNPQILEILDVLDYRRTHGVEVPGGTNDLVLKAVRAGLREVNTSDVSRYRDADTRDQENETLAHVWPDIQTAARKVAYTWPAVTTAEDMAQDLSVHFLERGGSLIKLADLPQDKRLARLVAIGNEKAASLRDDLDIFSGKFKYAVDEVRNLLENGALEGQLESYDTAVADLMVAIPEVAEQYQEALTKRFVDGEVPERNSSEQDAVKNGVVSLTTHMNRIHKSAQYDYENGGRHRNNRLATNTVDLDYTGEARFDEYDD